MGCQKWFCPCAHIFLAYFSQSRWCVLSSTVLSPSYCVIDSVLGGVHINRKRQRSPIVYTKDVCWAAMIKDRMFGNYTEVRQKSFFLLPSIQTDSDIAKKSRKFIPLSSSLSRYRKATQLPDCSEIG